MKQAFSEQDQNKNAKLLFVMTAHGLGMSAKLLHRAIDPENEIENYRKKLDLALEYVTDNVVFPAELPPFEPDVCQSPPSDSEVIQRYNELDNDTQTLYAGGNKGTIWIRVSHDFPVGALEKPFAVIGFTDDGHAVIKQQYVDFLQQFLPSEP